MTGSALAVPIIIVAAIAQAAAMPAILFNRILVSSSFGLAEGLFIVSIT
ncbi:MAG: hypothetical protein AB7S46_13250 [Flavobacteriaceae bacterium]